MTGKEIIIVPLELNSYTVTQVINQLNAFMSQDEIGFLELNFVNTHFVYPGGLSPLLAYLKENANDLNHHIILNSKNSEVDSYLRRMKCYSLLSLPDNYPWIRWSGKGRFQEPYYFTKNTDPNEVNKRSENIISMFIKDRHKMNYNQAIGWCINELIDNAKNHANSDVNVVMAQNYSSGVSEFCVSDRGIGIRESMGKADVKTALEECITKAKGQYSEGMGNGLYYTAELIKNDISGKCSMSIWSEDYMLTLYSNSNPEVKKLDHYWQGVNISISMYNGISSNLTDLKNKNNEGDAFSYENMPEYYENLFEN